MLAKTQALRSRTFDWIFEDWIIGALALNRCNSYLLPNSNVYYRIHGTNTTYNNIRSNQNGPNFNRNVLSISALALLFKDNPISRIFCLISIFKLWIGSLIQDKIAYDSS